MLSSLSCIGEESSSMLSIIFDEQCNYITSFEDSLYLFGLEENSIYVQDNINEDSPQSDVLLSYMSVTCSLSLSDTDSAVEKSNDKINVYYAQTDLIIDAFLQSGLHDSKLSAIAVIVCLFILSLSMGFNVLFGLLTIICIVFALVIAAGLLPAFGFRYFSAFNVLAVFVITGVGSDAILVFTSAWGKYMDIYQLVQRSVEPVDGSRSCCINGSTCGVKLPPDVLVDAYSSVVTALFFTVSTTVLSFMANLVSPIVVVAQLGAFMGCSMIVYFVLLHTVMIPGWLCVAVVNSKYGKNRWGVFGACFKSGGPVRENSISVDGNQESRDVSESLLTYDEDDELNAEEEHQNGGRGSESRGRRSSTSRQSSLRESVVPVVKSCRDVALKFCGCTTVSVRESQPDFDTYLSTNVGLGTYVDVQNKGNASNTSDMVSPVNFEEEDEIIAQTRAPKQSRVFGCAALIAVLGGLALVGLGLGSVIGTDWGLPLLFPKENNISKLMYVAINYKSDVLSLSNDGESDIPPVVVDPPTPSPTGEPGTPSRAPTLSPLTIPPTLTPTLSPVESISPTRYPTHAPSVHTERPTPSPATPLSDDDDDSKYTDYTVEICYGLSVKTESVDSVATADFNAKSFTKYAPVGLLDDAEEFCDYLASHRQHLELVTPQSDCLYNQLMEVTSEDISIFDRVYLWMEQNKWRYKQVGVVESEAGQGTFGPTGLLDMSWICQPLDCRANVSSFFDDPDHALEMIDRWEKALYKKGNDVAKSMNVDTLTGSDAWLFPVLSDQLVTALYLSSLLSFGGCLLLLFVSTLNLKLVAVVGLSMMFVIIVSLFLHAIFFSSIINLIDIVVLISFIGIIIDYPTHMAFHYMHDMEKELALTGGVLPAEAHKASFSYMRKSLVGPAMTTIFSAIPLLFADFTLVSKAGEYVVIMCLCTYVYVAVVLPILLRMINERKVFPCFTPLIQSVSIRIYGSHQ